MFKPHQNNEEAAIKNQNTYLWNRRSPGGLGGRDRYRAHWWCRGTLSTFLQHLTMLTLPHIHPAHSACAVHYIKLTPTSYDIEINLQLVEFGHIIIIFDYLKQSKIILYFSEWFSWMVLCLHMHKFLTLWTSTDKLSKQKASDWNLYEKGGLQGQTDPLMGLRLSLLLRSQQSELWQELASEQIVFVLCYPLKGKSCDMNGTMAVNVHCPSKTNCTFQRETQRQRYWRVSRIFFWSPN